MTKQSDWFDLRRTTGRLMAAGIVAVALCFAGGIGTAAAALWIQHHGPPGLTGTAVLHP